MKEDKMGSAPDEANGNIHIKGGPFYHTHFKWVPKVGEFIELTSLEDQLSPNRESIFKLKVVHVVHQLRDVTQKLPVSLKNADRSHWVNVYAVRTDVDFEKEWQ